MALHSTDSKEIALYYIGKAGKSNTKSEIVRNISIAKSILDMGYSKEHIKIAIDLYIDKMYSLGFVKCVIADVSKVIRETEKENEIKLANEKRANELLIHSEVDANVNNRNKEKLERGNNNSRFGKEHIINPFEKL